MTKTQEISRIVDERLPRLNAHKHQSKVLMNEYVQTEAALKKALIDHVYKLAKLEVANRKIGIIDLELEKTIEVLKSAYKQIGY